MPTKIKQSMPIVRQAKSQKISKLRFAGFSGEWEEKMLGEVANFWNGKAHEQDISANGKYVVVNSKFISQDGKVKKYSDNQISPLKKDDIAIVMSDIPKGKAIGKCFLIDKDSAYTLNQRIGGIKSKEIISQFLIRIINRNKYFLKFDNGVSQTNLRKNEILRCPVIFPALPEQQKIAEFLGAVDEWIENLCAQKENLEFYKRKMMQKIFAQEIRFKDNKGNNFSEWEEKKLGEVLDYEQPTNYIVESTEYNNNYNTPVLTAGKTFILGYTNEKEGIFEAEKLPVIIFDDFTTAQKFVDIPFKVKSSAMKILKNRSEKVSDIRFIFLTMQRIRFGLGEEHKRFWISEYSKIKIPFPIYKEQQKIADFLTSIDNLINSKQQQITQAEQWKKGLMQGLFV
ncbi:restriction endonuclease subunit S [Candidatus Parcubacteria bacterium]|nr:restriction endonuclease subunit S [Candidatus Parcubacteria bacterium]